MRPAFDFILDNSDCDDSNDDVNPDPTELCNSIDDDCDGQIDNNAADATTYFLDSDGDSYGDADQSIDECQQTPGYVLDSTDCDDNDGDIFPGAQEFCDGVDQELRWHNISMN